jgi:hypothetical protein
MATTGTGKWAEPGVPHRGWECVHIEDLGEPSATCEMCQVMTIRFVHTMSHPDYGDELRVGCVCAGHMEEDYEAAKSRETAMRARSSRRAKFPDRAGWRLSARGNRFINVGGFNIVAYPTHDHGHSGFSVRVLDKRSGRTVFVPGRYQTQVDAKLAAFDQMEQMKNGR